jgi:hypothetical protein
MASPGFTCVAHAFAAFIFQRAAIPRRLLRFSEAIHELIRVPGKGNCASSHVLTFAVCAIVLLQAAAS